MSDWYPTREETPTCRLRWKASFDGKPTAILEQEWECRQEEKRWTEWRQVPIEEK